MNLTSIMLIIIFIVFIFLLLRMIKKEMPLRDKRKKEEWEAELKRKEIIKNHHQKQDLEIQKTIKTEKKNQMIQKNIEKGRKYEEYIGNIFTDKGYSVVMHGLIKGAKDSGVDLIAQKDDIAYFIQCKFYEKSTLEHDKVIANQTKVRNFMKNNKSFTKYIKDKNKKILFVIPRRCLSKGAYKYIKENNDIMDFEIIPMSN